MLARKRNIVEALFFLSLALATLLLFASLSWGAIPSTQTQTTAIDLAPNRLPKKSKVPVAMHVVTATADEGCTLPAAPLSCGANGSEGPFPVPVPARLAYVSFDNDITFQSSKAEVCRSRTISDPLSNATGTDNSSAEAKCPRSLVGRGSALVRLPSLYSPWYTEISSLISVFRVPDISSRPAVILYVYVPSLNGYVQKLQGVLVRSPLSGYGKRLDITIPPLPAGGSLTRFDVTVGSGYRSGFVTSSCRDKKIKISGTFQYWQGSNSTNKGALTASSSSSCRN